MAHNCNRSKKRNNHQITARGTKGEDSALVLARTALQPTTQAALTLKNYDQAWCELDLTGLIDALIIQTQAVNEGDLNRAEAMLSAQAHTLDAIFNNLARRANNAEYMPTLECYLKLALRAQSQCRATWETLATIKHPPLAGYVKQANIAHGPQQVNNSTTTKTKPSRARETETTQNELLERKNGERLDFGAMRATGKADPAMATLAKVNRPED